MRYVVHQDLKRISKARVLVVALKRQQRAYVSRGHTSAYVSIRQRRDDLVVALKRCGLVYRRRTKAREKRRPAYVSIRQHTSAEGIRQRTSAYVSREATTWAAGVPDYLSTGIRQRRAYVSVRQHTSAEKRRPGQQGSLTIYLWAYVSGGHTSAYVSIRQQRSDDLGSRGP